MYYYYYYDYYLETACTTNQPSPSSPPWYYSQSPTGRVGYLHLYDGVGLKQGGLGLGVEHKRISAQGDRALVALSIRHTKTSESSE